MRKWIDVFNKYKHKINKYHITVIIFLVVTFFIGDNTFLDGIRYGTKIKSLENDIDVLKKNNENKLYQLNALQGNKDDLEQFAREQFLMTKNDEDLFLITK